MVFIAVVLAGSANPENIQDTKIKIILQRNSVLKKKLERFRIETVILYGEREILWQPDFEKISRVILKNAKSHFMYELGVPMLEEPAFINVKPLIRDDFRRKENI